jgi:hypothetical protein
MLTKLSDIKKLKKKNEKKLGQKNHATGKTIVRNNRE